MNTSVHSLTAAVKSGSIERVKQLTETFPLSYHKEWLDGYVLLRIALENNHSEVAKLLLIKGCKVNSRRSLLKPTDSPLHFAIKNGDTEIVEMLLERGIKISVSKSRQTPLELAVEKGNEATVDLLLKNCGFLTDIDSINKLMCLALEKEYLVILRYLLKYEAFMKCVCITHYLGDSTALHLAAGNGNRKLVKLLISNGFSVNAKGNYSVTPLHIAVDKGHAQIVEYFLKHGANINSRCLYNIHPPSNYCTCSKLSGSSYLYHRNECSFATCSCESGYAIANCTVLHLAAKTNREVIVELLLVNGADVNAEDENGITVLEIAIKNRNFQIFKIILSYCPDKESDSFRRCLRTAILNKFNFYNFDKNLDNPTSFQSLNKTCSQMFKMLLAYGCSFDLDCANVGDMLYAAVQSNNVNVVHELLKLLDTNAYVFIDDFSLKKTGHSLLHYAVMQKNSKMAQLLINFGADVRSTDRFGKPVIFYAIDNKDSEMSKLLLVNGASVRDGDGLFFYAVTQSCKEVLEAILTYEKIINSGNAMLVCLTRFWSSSYMINNLLKLRTNVNTDGDINSLLCCAVKQKSLRLAELLVGFGAEGKSKDENGNSFLSIAVVNNDPDLTAFLLTCGECVKDDIRVFHYAVRHLYLEVIKILFDYDDSIVNSCSDDGKTALHLAVCFESNYEVSNNIINQGTRTDMEFILSKKIELIKLLLCKGARINAQTNENMTPLHLAADLDRKYLDSGIVETLLENSANVNAKDINGMTALHIAACNGNLRIVKSLLKSNVINVSARRSDGKIALHLAAGGGNCDVVKILLLHGSNVDSRDYENFTPLFSAIEKHQYKCVELLLKFGANVELRDKKGKSPLYFAVFYWCTDIVELLLKFGADVNSVGYSGKTVYNGVTYSMDNPRYSYPCLVFPLFHFANLPDRQKNDDRLDISELLLAQKFKMRCIDPKYEHCLDAWKNVPLSEEKGFNELVSNSLVEVELLKDSIVTNNVSFYDLLTKSIPECQLALLSMNKTVKLLADSDFVDYAFPLFGDFLKCFYNRVLIRKNLVDFCHQVLFSCINNLNKLPHECLDEVFEKLSNDDLKSLLNACYHYKPIQCSTPYFIGICLSTDATKNECETSDTSHFL